MIIMIIEILLRLRNIGICVWFCDILAAILYRFQLYITVLLHASYYSIVLGDGEGT